MPKNLTRVEEKKLEQVCDATMSKDVMMFSTKNIQGSETV
jgi:hypothetical protein